MKYVFDLLKLFHLHIISSKIDIEKRKREQKEEKKFFKEGI